MGYNFQFPAVCGFQANNEYYIAMVPLSLLDKLFNSNLDVYILPEHRAQRKLNESRIPEIKDYIIQNRNSYVFSAITASVDGNISFKENKDSSQIGSLEIDMAARFVINDGQHRYAAIQSALEDDPSLGEETISIVFFKDQGLQRSQQMFTDLNKHAVKSSNSLSTLYDSRDELAVATKAIVQNIKFFNMFTDREKDILGKNSSNLFTINNIYKSNYRVIHSKYCTEEDQLFLYKFWSTVVSNIIEWNELLNRHITKRDLKENYILTLGITIQALGRLGAYFYEHPEVDLNNTLAKLKEIDWLRNNHENWMRRAIREDGKILTNEEAIILTTNKIKQLINVELSQDEKSREVNLAKLLKKQKPTK